MTSPETFPVSRPTRMISEAAPAFIIAYAVVAPTAPTPAIATASCLASINVVDSFRAPASSRLVFCPGHDYPVHKS